MEVGTASRRPSVCALLLVVIAGCGPVADPAPPSARTATAVAARSAATTPPATTSPPAAASTSPSAAPVQVGLVSAVEGTDLGGANAAADEGAKLAAADLGATYEAIDTEEAADYAANIDTFVQHGFAIVITVGSDAASSTMAAARAAPAVRFIGVDQRACVTSDGAPDPSGGCAGDASTLLPNYQAIAFADEQSGYLAGIAAAEATRNGVVGVVGGSSAAGWVVRSWRGFENGARSVDPTLSVLYEEVSADPATGFGDPAAGRALGEKLIGQRADVLFELALASGDGVIDAACAAGIVAIGSLVDEAAIRPDRGACILTSAERHTSEAVRAAVGAATGDAFEAGTVIRGLSDDPPSVGLAPSAASRGSPSSIEAATRAMSSGAIDPCAPLRCTLSGT
jgi:basic membrane protein A